MATPHKFLQVFDRFLTSLMAVDHFLYTNAQSTEDNVFCFSRAFYRAIHQTCQKPVKNLYETYAGWPRLGAPDYNDLILFTISLVPTFILMYFDSSLHILAAKYLHDLNPYLVLLTLGKDITYS